MAEITIGRIVIYRSRTGRYDVPAIVTATADTLDPQGVKLYEESEHKKGVPPLSSPQHVHLTVLTPGLPGFRAEGLKGEADTPLAERDKSDRPAPEGYSENVAGCYQEWDVPHFSLYTDAPPGSWRWPEAHLRPDARSSS